MKNKQEIKGYELADEAYNKEVTRLLSKITSDLKKLSARFTFGDSMMKLVKEQQAEFVKKLQEEGWRIYGRDTDLISRSALKEVLKECAYSYDGVNTWIMKDEVLGIIDNAPTVEVPENAVNCVLTMFGECSYNKTGCSDCEIKEKIRKAMGGRQ